MLQVTDAFFKKKCKFLSYVMTVLDINMTPQTVRAFQRKTVVGNFVVKSDDQFRRPQDHHCTRGFCASLLLEVPVNKIKLRPEL